MIGGTSRDVLDEVLDLAEPVGAAVVSVEYRARPETPHPGPVEDCYAGLVWTAEHAGELGIDEQRIVLIGGSAGAGIAAAVALLARDRGGPVLAGQLLMCPMLDDRNDTPSAHQMAELPMWNRTANEVGWTALLGDAPRRPGCLALRRSGPGGGPVRATAGIHRRRIRGHLPRRGRRPTRAGSGRPAASPSCTSGPAASTASTASRHGRHCRGPLFQPAPTGSAGCWPPESRHFVRRHE